MKKHLANENLQFEIKQDPKTLIPNLTNNQQEETNALSKVFEMTNIKIQAVRCHHQQKSNKITKKQMWSRNKAACQDSPDLSILINSDKHFTDREISTTRLCSKPILSSDLSSEALDGEELEDGQDA